MEMTQGNWEVEVRAFRRSILFAVGLTMMMIFATGCSKTPQQKYAQFFAEGKKQLEANDYRRAILDFQNAIQAKPKDAEAYYQIGLAYLNATQLKEAIVSLRTATELNPRHTAAQLKLAELMIRTHNEQIIKGAESRIQSILTESPSDNDALFMLAATQAQLGKIEDAEKYLSEVLKRSPQHFRSAIALAQVKISQKDVPGAQAVLKKLVEQSPNSSEAAAALGTLYAATGKLADAEVLLHKAVQLDPKNGGVLNALGSVLLKAGKKTEAEQTYKQIALLPGSEHRLAYAIFLMQQNRPAEAVTELQRLVKANRNDRIARSGLVAGYLATNRSAEAKSLLDEALKENPKDMEALIQRSQILLQSGNLKEAKRDLEVVLHVDPSAQAHYLMSKVFRSEDEFARQRQELDEALRLAPESLRVRMELADALLRSNSAKAALETLNGTQEIDKHSLRYLVARNWVLIALGDTNEARKGVDAALAVGSVPDAMLQDGVLRFASQDFARARVSLEGVLQSNPGICAPYRSWFSRTWHRIRRLRPPTGSVRPRCSSRSRSDYRCSGPHGWWKPIKRKKRGGCWRRLQPQTRRIPLSS